MIGAVEGVTMSELESSPDQVPDSDHAGAPLPEKRLLTIREAASLTGLSTKALARRIERGTLRAVKDAEGRRVVPRGELERADLLEEGSPVAALVVWRDLYERERLAAAESRERAAELELELVAIANAGPIRAFKLRRGARVRLAERL